MCVCLMLTDTSDSVELGWQMVEGHHVGTELSSQPPYLQGLISFVFTGKLALTFFYAKTFFL